LSPSGVPNKRLPFDPLAVWNVAPVQTATGGRGFMRG
jgi:hypothetical protein